MTRPISDSEGSSTLARRLKELRESRFSKPVTQPQLAKALSGDKPLSVSSISAYENPSKPSPPEPRLRDYATFFASERSIAEDGPRLLSGDEMTPEERTARDQLLDELLSLAHIPAAQPSAPALTQTPIRADRHRLWSFPEGEAIRIVCGRLENMEYPYADPTNRNYTELLHYADSDALIELFGHLRMLNPTCDIRFMLDRDFGNPDDLNRHVVILGGSSLNPAIEKMHDSAGLPIKQRPKSKKIEEGDAFEVPGTDEQFEPLFDENLGLVEDIGLFARLVNPYNSARTWTVCSGIFSRGVLGVVRTLTDATLRDRNERFLRQRFGAQQFAVLIRVPVLLGKAVTPDLYKSGVLDYVWSDGATGTGSDG